MTIEDHDCHISPEDSCDCQREEAIMVLKARKMGTTSMQTYQMIADALLKNGMTEQEVSDFFDDLRNELIPKCEKCGSILEEINLEPDVDIVRCSNVKCWNIIEGADFLSDLQTIKDDE